MRACLLPLLLCASAALREDLPAAADKPNFVLIYTDDLDFDEVGAYRAADQPCALAAVKAGLKNQPFAYADPRMLTPHLDSIARDGALLDRFYICSPVCTPSRYGILTGRYASRSPGFLEKNPAGAHANITWNTPISPSETNIAKSLKALGYATGIVGKWHNFFRSGERAWKRIPEGADPRDTEIRAKLQAQYADAQAQIRECGFDFVERINIGNTEEVRPAALRFQNMEWHTEGALEFLDRHGKQPFFLYFPTPIPHGNYAANVFKTRDPLATTAGMLDKAPAPQPSRDDVLARLRAAGIDERNAMGTWQDDSIGAILKKLEELGVSDNTVVIHISDHQSRGKYTCYEGARVPAAIRWPGKIKPGTRIGALCANIDIAPTLIEAAGGTVPGGTYDGRSLLPILQGKGHPADWRDSVFLEISNIRAVVTTDWKFIANRTVGKIREAIEADARAAVAEGRPRQVGWEGSADPKGKGVRYASDRAFPAYFDPDQLYDLRSDPLEQHNLATDPAHTDQLEKMKDLLRSHLAPLPHTFGEFKTQ